MDLVKHKYCLLFLQQIREVKSSTLPGGLMRSWRFKILTIICWDIPIPDLWILLFSYWSLSSWNKMSAKTMHSIFFAAQPLWKFKQKPIFISYKILEVARNMNLFSLPMKASRLPNMSRVFSFKDFNYWVTQCFQLPLVFYQKPPLMTF